MRILLLFSLCLLWCDLQAFDPDRTFVYDSEAEVFVAPAPPDPIYLSGGTLIDGTGSPARSNVGLLLRHGRIESVRASDVPGDARVIDATGMWILPGMFDMHAHITFHWPSGAHAEDDILNATRAERYLESYQSIGVTTVRDVASKHRIGYSLKRSQRMGFIGGARLYVSGPGITVTGGHPTELRPNEPAAYAIEADGATMMRKSVRAAVRDGADFIKVLPPYTEDEIAAVVSEAGYWKLRVTAHVGGDQDLMSATPRRAVSAGFDGIEHLYSLGPEDAVEELLEEISDRNIYLTPTVGHHMRQLGRMDDVRRAWMKENINYTPESVLSLLQRAHEQGIKIAVGTDSNAVHMRVIGDLYLEELNGLMSGGLSAMEVIMAASLNAAEAMGISDELGSVTEGKMADMILVENNPLLGLEALVVPALVIQDGKIVHEKR
ncbi:amidohydrolase family protein [Elongatibacter sediminis]|uniref:Amidohydrolase family protein n=1 Tax=Elongatibacter sediminis TaxID=3119006 RepID=A0AAW9RH61_9GAMM